MPMCPANKASVQLVHAWELQYKEAQAEYDFYCAQTTSDLAEIASAVHEKEVTAIILHVIIVIV